jgi:hypothetical protein
LHDQRKLVLRAECHIGRVFEGPPGLGI